jgi:predicted double-glycine peptidase
MKYYFNVDITENELLEYTKKTFSKQEYTKIKKTGLSFYELEIISRSMGYQSASVRLELPALLQLTGPVIVFLKTKYFRHFAVLRGVIDDRVYIADPSRGNIRITVQEFAKEWNGETFVLGKEGFGTPVKHSLAILHHSRISNEQTLLRQSLLDKPQVIVPRL